MADSQMDEAAIFDAARKIASPETRRRYLLEACGDDHGLLARVEALLRIHEEDRTFLKMPAETAEASEVVGKQIGSYKLLEQIGEGGFGVVFMAEQQHPLRRIVALKVLKPGMDTRQIVARFEAERQALALMDHPNIARVLDGGETSSGRPYFVMELVKGIPITRYCDEHRLTPRERLSLFAMVCEAVQHAHQKGIIHRDIKPTNVLVAAYDGKPVPKVIDFGVAKALGQKLTERTLVTEFGGIIGTLEYMSPEQAEFNALDVDTRADIYSLGVLLYELLTGTTPLTRERLKRAAVSEALRLIREEDPPKPSTRLSDSKDSLASISAQRQLEPARLAREVRGELDWIVMKCLEKDRTRRYEAADGVARDIQRYLQDEPVEASPPSRTYRLRKFARKNRKLIVTAGAFALLLMAGAGVSAWQAVRAWAAETRALTAWDREAEQLKQALKSEARARAVREFFEKHVLSAARPKGQEGGLGTEATIRAALDRAEPEIAKSFANDPLVEASIRNTLGVSYWYLCENEKALQQQQRALALRRQELGPDHPETVGAMNDVAIILHNQGRYEEEEKLLTEVVAVKRRTLGPEDPLTLKSMNNLANALAERGLLEEASKLSEDTMLIQRRLLGREDLFTLRSTYNLAIMWRFLGRLDEAHKAFDETLEILRRVFGPDHQDTLRVMNELGELLLDEGRGAEAYKVFAETMEGKRRVLGARHMETLVTMANLADALRDQNRLDEACKQAEEAVELHRQVFGPEHPQTLVALTILASVYRDQGRFAEARKLYESTLTLLRRLMGPKTPEMQKVMNEYAWMLAATANPMFRDPPRAVELAKEIIQNAPKLANKWETLGVAYYRAGGWQDAIAALEKSENLAPQRPAGGRSFFLAMAHWQLGHKDQARQWYGKGVQWMETRPAAGEQLRQFKAEAARLLGMSGPVPSGKTDVK